MWRPCLDPKPFLLTDRLFHGLQCQHVWQHEAVWCTGACPITAVHHKTTKHWCMFPGAPNPLVQQDPSRCVGKYYYDRQANRRHAVWRVYESIHKCEYLYLKFEPKWHHHLRSMELCEVTLNNFGPVESHCLKFKWVQETIHKVASLFFQLLHKYMANIFNNSIIVYQHPVRQV